MTFACLLVCVRENMNVCVSEVGALRASWVKCVSPSTGLQSPSFRRIVDLRHFSSALTFTWTRTGVSHTHTLLFLTCDFHWVHFHTQGTSSHITSHLHSHVTHSALLLLPPIYFIFKTIYIPFHPPALCLSPGSWARFSRIASAAQSWRREREARTRSYFTAAGKTSTNQHQIRSDGAGPTPFKSLQFCESVYLKAGGYYYLYYLL